ncbi:MAG: DnaA regulatory inactivator Hda [Rubrivivax sp.]
MAAPAVTRAAQLQLPLPIGPRPAREFRNFVTGANAAVLAQVRSLSLPSRPPAAPLYLWGPPGSGKSHLLQALASQVREGGAQVAWFDAAGARPAALLSETALLVLDGCDGFDAEAQQQAFRHFVEATTLGVQVVAGGRLPPVDLPLRDDLRTRLGWGLVFALEPLSEADTRHALLQEMAGRGIEMADGVLRHLLTHFPRDLTHLMDLLDRLDDHALASQRRLTVPLVRELMQIDADPAARSA